MAYEPGPLLSLTIPLLKWIHARVATSYNPAFSLTTMQKQGTENEPASLGASTGFMQPTMYNQILDKISFIGYIKEIIGLEW
jgi:hypothetical protein